VVEQLLAYLRRNAAAAALSSLALQIAAAAAAPVVSAGGAIPAWAANYSSIAGVQVGNALAGPLVSLAAAAVPSPLVLGGADATAAGGDTSSGPSSALIGGIGGAAAVVVGLTVAALLFLLRRQKARRTGRLRLGQRAGKLTAHAAGGQTDPVLHANPGFRGAKPAPAGALKAGASSGGGTVQAARLHAALGSYKQGGSGASSARRGPPPGVLPGGVRRGGGAHSAADAGAGGGAGEGEAGIEFSANPLAVRAALSFAPTTTGVPGAGRQAAGRAAGGRNAAVAPRSRGAAVAPPSAAGGSRGRVSAEAAAAGPAWAPQRRRQRR